MAEPLRVLVVDDETALANVIAGYLHREGFDVDLAHDGLSAVDSARTHRPARRIRSARGSAASRRGRNRAR